MEQKHSPLPWKVVQEPEYGSRTRIITANKPSTASLSIASTEQPCYVAIPNGKTQEANAQFIVQACNAHGILLQACKDALYYLRQCEMDFSLPPSTKTMKDILSEAIAAITKVGAKL